MFWYALLFGSSAAFLFIRITDHLRVNRQRRERAEEYRIFLGN
jgi:hypothetical protein